MDASVNFARGRSRRGSARGRRSRSASVCVGGTSLRPPPCSESAPPPVVTLKGRQGAFLDRKAAVTPSTRQGEPLMMPRSASQGVLNMPNRLAKIAQLTHKEVEGDARFQASDASASEGVLYGAPGDKGHLFSTLGNLVGGNPYPLDG